MKQHNMGPQSRNAGRGTRSSVRIPTIPMEWMDPMSWRLPSGKALAEFWLQAGFLAPLMLGSPMARKTKPKAPMAALGVENSMVEEKRGEARERGATFRQSR